MGDCYCGTVFTLKTDGTGFTGLYSFTGSAFSDGANPQASLILDACGNLYGTTWAGGTVNVGTVFTLKTDGTGFTILHSFSRDFPDGGNPQASLILDADSNLYGTTRFGGLGSCFPFFPMGCGTVFMLKTDGTGYTILHHFNGGTSVGGDPFAALILDAFGNLYGTTARGGPSPSGGSGTVFTLKTDGTGYTVLHFFVNGTGDGETPEAPLILDPAGNLYGTTARGGSLGYGTVFVLP